ncbi:MAG: hypothetical protein IJW03_00230 [Clostridia bacterium]|nr:hypothetical protein [Clostridia bacterium]
MIYSITNGCISAQISDIGAELISVRGSDGFEYIWGADETYWDKHAPLLFPVCGRLVDQKYVFSGKEYRMDIHGFAKDSKFTVKNRTDDSLTLELSSSETTREIYPFDFSLTAQFSLKDASLLVNFTVKNTGNSTLPYMLGWHPGFVLESDCPVSDFSLTFDRENIKLYPLQHGCFVSPSSCDYTLTDCKYFINDEQLAKVDTLIFRECGKSVTLGSEHTAHSLTLEWSETLPYFCIWKRPAAEARYVCLEPWSDVPSDGESAENFETRRMSHLEKNVSKSFCCKISFK